MNKIKFNHLIFLSLISALTFFTLYSIPAADNWWNLATGRYIWENHKLPFEDVFSYTVQGREWILTQWLPEIIFYVIYLILGLKGIYLLRTVILLITFGLIFSICNMRKLNPITSSIFLILSIYMAQPYYYFDIRSYLFSYLFTGLYLFFLERRRVEGKFFPLWLFPLVNCLWVNTHSAYLLGFLIIFSYFIDEYFQKEGGKKSSLFLVKIGIITFVSSFLNPYTYKILIYPFRLGMGSGFWQNFLNEWNPPDLLGKNLPYGIFWLICTLVILFTVKKANIRDLLIYSAFTYLSFKAVRHITLFCLIITPVLVKHLEIILNNRRNLLKNQIEDLLNKSFYSKIAVIIICITIFIRTIIAVFTVDFSLEKEFFPYDGVNFIKENSLPGRLYNPYEWGGYIIWTLYPEKLVFCDGRADIVYTEEICKESYFCTKGEDLSILDKYSINIVLCNKINELHGMELPGKLMEKSDLWILIYTDENSYVFIKNVESNKKIIENFYRGKLKIPPTSYGNYYQGSILLDQKNFDLALKYFERSVELNENFIESWMSMGFILAVTGNMEEAEKSFLKVLSIDPLYPTAHYNLGLIYKSRKNLTGAEIEFRKELEIHEYYPARKELENLFR